MELADAVLAHSPEARLQTPMCNLPSDEEEEEDMEVRTSGFNSSL